MKLGFVLLLLHHRARSLLEALEARGQELEVDDIQSLVVGRVAESDFGTLPCLKFVCWYGLVEALVVPPYPKSGKPNQVLIQIANGLRPLNPLMFLTRITKA